MAAIYLVNGPWMTNHLPIKVHCTLTVISLIW